MHAHYAVLSSTSPKSVYNLCTIYHTSTVCIYYKDGTFVVVGCAHDFNWVSSVQPSCQQHQTLIIEEFEPDVFRQLIEYIHTGCVTLQPRTLLGIVNHTGVLLTIERLT